MVTGNTIVPMYANYRSAIFNSAWSDMIHFNSCVRPAATTFISSSQVCNTCPAIHTTWSNQFPVKSYWRIHGDLSVAIYQFINFSQMRESGFNSHYDFDLGAKSVTTCPAWAGNNLPLSVLGGRSKLFIVMLKWSYRSIKLNLFRIDNNSGADFWRLLKFSKIWFRNMVRPVLLGESLLKCRL